MQFLYSKSKYAMSVTQLYHINSHSSHIFLTVNEQIKKKKGRIVLSNKLSKPFSTEEVSQLTLSLPKHCLLLHRR